MLSLLSNSMKSVFFVLLYIVLGMLPGIVSIAHIKHYEKTEKAYGTINTWYILIIILISVFTMCFSCRYGLNSVSEWLKYFSAGVCVWLLLLTSYMDQRSGMFHVMPLIVAVFIELILLAAAVAIGHMIYPKEYWMMALVIQLFLFLMSIKGYSKGDFGILSVCMYTYLIVCPDEFLYAVCINLFIAMLLFVCRNLFRIKVILKTKNCRLPFTIYIAIGTFVSLLIYA